MIVGRCYNVTADENGCGAGYMCNSNENGCGVRLFVLLRVTPPHAPGRSEGYMDAAGGHILGNREY